MAVGAVYQLIANQGKMDNLLTANKFLNQRIAAVVCAKRRLAAGDPSYDIMPSLSDIEKTHILFVNAKYKPFVTTAMEYKKYTYTGTALSGNECSVEIQQFGDFFVDMVFKTIFNEIATSAGRVPAFPAMIGTTLQSGVDLTKMVSTTDSGVVPGPVWRYTQKYTDFAENAKSATSADGATLGSVAYNYVRFCEYPGVRLFEETKFEIASAPLDKYTHMAAITIAKKFIQPNKMTAWKKLVGQEVAIESYSDALAYPLTNGYVGPMGEASFNASNSWPDASGLPFPTKSYKKAEQFYAGLQTPQAGYASGAVILWTPLWFWFNTDVHLAIPSAAIPFNNRYVRFRTARKADILSVAPGNLLYSVTVEGFTTSTGAYAGLTPAINFITERSVPVLATGSVLTGGDVGSIELYINNLFIQPEIHEMFIKRIGFSMIRIYLEQTVDVNTSSVDNLMQMFKYPIEYFFVGGLPDANLAADVAWRDWHRYSYVHADKVDDISRSIGSTLGASIALTLTYPVQRKLATNNIITTTPTINGLKVYVAGVTLSEENTPEFYSQYIPYNYGKDTINTNHEDGSLMVNFSLFPGIYQPSGHFNVSRANNFYVRTETRNVPILGKIKIFYIAKAINFLLIADGSCVLRYTA